MSGADSNLEYHFGQFRLQAARPELWRGTEKIQLTRKRHEILVFLVRSDGRVLGKEELLDAIWPEKSVEESNLSNQIYTLRRIIEEDPANPKMIVTVPGFGYQFQEKVRVVQESATATGLETPPATTLAPPLSHRPWLLMMVVGTLILLTAGGLWFQQRRKSRSTSPLLSIPITYYQGAESYPSLSPSGQLLAFTWDGDHLKNTDLYVKQVAGGEPIRITSHPSEEILPTWSPDGNWLAFLRRAEPVSDPLHLIIVPALGGMEREVARVYGGLDWSPDGKYLAVVNPATPEAPVGIHLISIDGEESRVLTYQPDQLPYFDSSPRFSLDGELVAFVRWKSDANGDIFTVNLKSKEIRQLTFDQAVIGNASLQWTGNGRELMFISNRTGNFQLWKTSPNGEPPHPVLNSNWPIDYYSISRNPDLLVYVPKLHDTLIEVMSNVTDSKSRNNSSPCLINSTQIEQAPRLSPDGSTLVFISNRTGWDEVWTARSDCTQSRQLTNFNSYGLGSPRWSPDGKRIAFDRRVDGRPEIFIIGNDGTGLRRVTSTIGSTRPCWSPDGEWIYFTLYTPGPPDKEQIWRSPVNGGVMTQITGQGGMEPNLSPDGKRLYYSRGHHLYQKDLPSGAETPVPGLENVQIDRYWDISNSAIFYVTLEASELKNKTGLYRFDLQTRTSSLLREIDKLPIPWQLGLTVTPDESRHAISLINQQIGDIMMVTGWR